jgi:hypothetical protein
VRWQPIRPWILLSILVVGCCGVFSSSVSAKEVELTASPSFVRDVAPILLKNCLACHDEQEANGGYQVSSFESLLKAGESEEPAVVPKDHAMSRLYQLIASDDAEERMPRDAEPLSADEIARIREWIDAGAEFDGADRQAPLASLIPRLPHPAPPESYPRPVPITAVTLRPATSELFVGGYHELTVWDAGTGQLLRRISDIPERVHAIEFNADGSRMIVAGGTPGVSGEDASGNRERTLLTTTDIVFDAEFSPTNDRVAVCGADRAIYVFDTQSGSELVKIEDHADWVTGIAWNAEGSQLASASRDKTSKVFDAATGASQVTYPGYGEQLYAVVFAPDRKQVYVAGRGGKIHAWKIEDGTRAADFGGFGQEIYGLQVVGEEIVACSSDGTVRAFRLNDHQEARQWTGLEEWAYSLSLAGDANRLAAGAYNGRVIVWPLDGTAPVASFVAAPGLLAPGE